jgi:RteC protein
MTKPFDTLYTEMAKALTQIARTNQGPDKYLRSIESIRQSIGKVGLQGAKFMRNKSTEIEFFRNVWPGFHAQLLLYIWLFGIELRRGLEPADDWQAFLQGEEKRLALFFKANQKFWQYYRAGARGLDQQFTRAYRRNRILEPLAMIIDQEGATLASYRAASDADLAEWLFGIQEVGAVQYQGQPADISRLQKWACLALGWQVANIYDRGGYSATGRRSGLPLPGR